MLTCDLLLQKTKPTPSTSERDRKTCHKEVFIYVDVYVYIYKKNVVDLLQPTLLGRRVRGEGKAAVCLVILLSNGRSKT